MKKRILSALTAFMCAVSMAAVTPVSAEEPERDYIYTGSLEAGGDKLTILCWLPDDIEPMVEMWLKDTGYSADKVNIVSFNAGSGSAPEEYEKYLKGGGDADIILIDSNWAMDYFNDDTKTAPLSDLGFTDGDFSDQYDYALELGRNSDGVLKGVSYEVAPGAWCYRTDLAEKYLGVTSPEEMQEKINSVNNFANTCEAVYTASKGSTAMTATEYGLFSASMHSSKTQPWAVDGEFNPEIKDSYLSQVAMAARMIRGSGYVTDKKMWTDDWQKLGQTDETMGYFIPSWGFGEAMLLSAAGGKNGKTYGKWGVCEGPMPYYWGAVMMSVYPETDNADMAADFIDYFTVNSETIKKYVLESEKCTYDMPNNMTVVQELINEGTDNDKVIDDLLGGQERLEVLDRNARALELSYENITPYDSKIETELFEALEDYCEGKLTSDKEFISSFKDKAAMVINDGILKGDISGNGKIDLYDAIEVAKSLIGVRTFTDEEKKIADFNGDGKVDLYDAIGIAKYILTHK